MNLDQWAREIHEIAVEHGWWDEERSFGEIVALCHSELSEALEAFFLPGWEDEPGCRVERSVCEYFNIVCCDLSGDAEHGYAMPGGQMRL